jgi:uncharacterized membrane-anchored protein
LSANAVPEITVLFWIVKVLTTGMGKAMSDFRHDDRHLEGALAQPRPAES